MILNQSLILSSIMLNDKPSLMYVAIYLASYVYIYIPHRLVIQQRKIVCTYLPFMIEVMHLL